MEDYIKKAIEQMKRGEEKGFNTVYSATYNRVYFRARQIMKKEEDAQDLTQIVFTEAYKNIHTLQAVEALYGWLDGITYNQGMKIYRKQKDVLLTEEAEGMFEEIESNDISSMPELTADQKATAEIIKGIIEELPELQKTAVVAYYFDGLKVEQIAEMMECSVNTVKSRLNYARKYIKNRVEEKEKEEGYRLHVFGLPVLWYALKKLAEETSLSVYAAQKVYGEACANVGLEATPISVSSVGAEAGAITGTATEATSGAGVDTDMAPEATSSIGTGTTTGAAAKGTMMNIILKNVLVAGVSFGLSFAVAFGVSQMTAKEVEFTTIQQAQAILDGQNDGNTEVTSQVTTEAESVQEADQGVEQDTTQDVTKGAKQEAKEGEIQFDWSLDDWTFNGIHISDCSYRAIEESLGFNPDERTTYVENWNGHGWLRAGMVTDSDGNEKRQITHAISDNTYSICYQEYGEPDNHLDIGFYNSSEQTANVDFSYISDVPYTFGDYEVFDPIFHISEIIEKGIMQETEHGIKYSFTSNLGEGTLNITDYAEENHLYTLRLYQDSHQFAVAIGPNYYGRYQATYKYFYK